MTVEIIGAIWRDEVLSLTWAAWLDSPKDVSWL